MLGCWGEEDFQVIYPSQARKAKVLEFEAGEVQGEGTVDEELNAVIMEPQEEEIVEAGTAQKKTAKSLLNTFPFNVPNDEEHSHDHHHAEHEEHHGEHHGEHHEHHEEAQVASKATQEKFPFNLPLRAPLSNRQTQTQAEESSQGNPPTILNEIANSGRKCIDKVS